MTDTPSDVRPPGLVIVLDAIDATRLAEFWASALGYDQQGAVAHFRVLVPRVGEGPAVLVQQVTGTVAGSNRVHLDLHVVDREAEADRLVERGAHRLRNGALDALRWITMTDPEGNVFDVVEDPPG